MSEQIATFEELFGKIKPNGVVPLRRHALVLPTRLRRWPPSRQYFHGVQQETDRRAQRVSLGATLAKSYGFTRSVDSIHYYDSIIVIEKRARKAPTTTRSGQPQFEDGLEGETVHQARVRRAKRLTLYGINTALRAMGLPGYRWR